MAAGRVADAVGPGAEAGSIILSNQITYLLYLVEQ